MLMDDSTIEKSEWTTVIKPRESLLSVDFKEIWRYRDLWQLFVKRDIANAVQADNTRSFVVFRTTNNDNNHVYGRFRRNCQVEY